MAFLYRRIPRDGVHLHVGPVLMALAYQAVMLLLLLSRFNPRLVQWYP